LARTRQPGEENPGRDDGCFSYAQSNHPPKYFKSYASDVETPILGYFSRERSTGRSSGGAFCAFCALLALFCSAP
jgi:hypothetical protein